MTRNNGEIQSARQGHTVGPMVFRVQCWKLPYSERTTPLHVLDCIVIHRHLSLSALEGVDSPC
jgi:hypothetical protein